MKAQRIERVRTRSGRGAALVAVAAAVATGCAGVGPAQRSPGTLEAGKFAPARAAAAQYGPNGALTCPGSGAVGLLQRDVGEQKGSGGARPQADGSLCAAAEALLGWDQPETPPESVVRFVANYFGNAAPVRRVITATLETEDARQVASRLSDSVVNFANNAKNPRYGAATLRVRKATTKIVLLLQDPGVELQPTPRTVPAGAQVAVAGRLLGDLVNPKVLASSPVGKLEVVPATGKEFHAQLACGDRPGRMQVEIRGEKDGEPTSVAQFPVGCGAPLASSVTVPAPVKGNVDEAQAARRFFELTNADRAEIGLPPLSWDPAVAGVARSAAEYVRDQSRGSAAPFDLVAKLSAADVASPIVLQNPVSATSVEEAHALVQASAVDRANVLNPEVTHGAAGVVVTNVPDVGPVLYVSELLVKELPPFDPQVVAGTIRQAIAQRRADARAAPLADDRQLDEIAQRYAAALADARGNLPKEKADALVAPLYKGFSTVNLISGVKIDPVEFAQEPAAVAPAKILGVGVAPGTSAALGKNSAYVVIITATRR